MIKSKNTTNILNTSSNFLLKFFDQSIVNFSIDLNIT